MTLVSRSLLGALLFAAVAAGGVIVATEAEAANCPANMSGFNANANGESITCTCPPGSATGAVWGTNMYTTDSSVCAAAAHMGVIQAQTGGNVTVYMAEGCPSYNGTQRNGVTTRRWGSYQKSFAFSWPAPGCGKQTAATTIEACPANLNAMRGQSGQTLTCSCRPQQFGGSIWGTGRYTTDSSVCGAALHAGAIPATGGAVSLTVTGGCSRFVGTDGNGIRTSDWGAYDSSFYFGSNEPACR